MGLMRRSREGEGGDHQGYGNGHDEGRAVPATHDDLRRNGRGTTSAAAAAAATAAAAAATTAATTAAAAAAGAACAKESR